MHAEAVRNMAQSARRTMILTESKKFSQVGVVPLLSYNELDTIYTDDKISDEAKKNWKPSTFKLFWQLQQNNF